MGEWPKTVFVRGIRIEVDDWQEMDEVIQRYGSGDMPSDPAGDRPVTQRQPNIGPGRLSPTDHTILLQFVEGGQRGVTTSQVGPALNKQGKGIRMALEAWSRRIGLVTEEGGSAFEPVQRADGRGFKLVDVYLRAARAMLGMM